MLIELLMKLGEKILTFIFSMFNLPEIPPEYLTTFTDLVLIIKSGFRVISFFVPVDYFLTLCSVLMGLYTAGFLWHTFLWIWSKIPVIGSK